MRREWLIETANDRKGVNLHPIWFQRGSKSGAFSNDAHETIVRCQIEQKRVSKTNNASRESLYTPYFAMQVNATVSQIHLVGVMGVSVECQNGI